MTDTMNETTRQALLESIAKWEENAIAEAPEDVRIGARDCPLCTMFLNPFNKVHCFGCPVVEQTSATSCSRTPYSKAFRSYLLWDDDPKSETPRTAFHEAARAEVDFLKSLLPKGQ